jgi:hypothetical protein
MTIFTLSAWIFSATMKLTHSLLITCWKTFALYLALGGAIHYQKSMRKTKIYHVGVALIPDVNVQREALPFFLSPVVTSFPSPAEDYQDCKLDLHEYLAKKPRSYLFSAALRRVHDPGGYFGWRSSGCSPFSGNRERRHCHCREATGGEASGNEERERPVCFGK